ncbi:HPP family protein [Pseudoalteromonas citrea]|uniref:HPP family protein n=1 Tax=Pseudoalteromonas citrea TaxID=43655 RepID=A0A5S3XNF0_9GAMM|nr:HPP family protein [Pseudoalteromonas citrea]TMP43007.1 HPP family protein [Pseudoalteromonas citrea]TMP58430.1 HPP family protein [Pseudoalteromonas citrea]
MKFKDKITAGIGAGTAIALLGLLEKIEMQLMLLIAPFGASVVLIFGVPSSPLANPKNVILGHLLTASIGLLFVNYSEVNTLTIALATGLAVSLMLLTNTTHPPAGANPILIMITAPSWQFLIFPIFTGTVIMVLTAKVIERCRQRV